MNVVFISTYPPRECGIANFTYDLINSLEDFDDINCYVISLSKDKYDYDERVLFDIYHDNFSDYIKAIKIINSQNIDIAVIEHEYGIFGGEDGRYIIPMAKMIKKPIITTFHTVLRNPSQNQFDILKALADISYKVITMANSTKEILIDLYGINKEKIEVIHHGVPYMNLPSKEILKEKYGLKGKKVISTFGLLSPGKGLEYAILAMDKVRNSFPNTVYLILGQTHPNVKKEKGEEYREKLIKLVKDLNLEDNVKFVDKYLTKKEILEYLKLTDIYLTPYRGREQAVSGTLAYALGCGKAIISTPYTYAKEMLSNGRGILVNFEDSNSIALAIIKLLGDEKLRRELEEKALEIGKEMYWYNVAKKMIEIFNKINHVYRKEGVVTWS
jgi:glycosyltransferase involved in cell wall biosynthesis